MPYQSNSSSRKDERRSNLDRRTFLGGTASLLAGLSATSGAASAALSDEREEHINSLIEQMTLEEKIQMVHGHEGPESDPAIGYIPPIPRLGIPDLQLTDGPVGIRHGQATAFPATIGLAATWDRNLVEQFGTALGKEAKARDQDVLLAPAMNINRVPTGGRTFEYFSEDPYLSGEVGVSYTDGVQSEGIIATAKHYIANNQEAYRHEVSADISERALREIYLPSFKAAVQDGNIGSVMASYNRVNGERMTENERLLTDVLKNEWGFDGYVVSDWGATYSTVDAAKAGLDLEMPQGKYFGKDLRKAVQDGRVSIETLDDKVTRIIREMSTMGILDGEYNGGPGVIDSQSHRALARQTAEEGAVMLKNEDETLPLDEDELNSIAVLGLSADEAKVGGGGSSDVAPIYTVDPLSAIEDRVGEDTTIEYEPGDARDGFSPIPSTALTPPGANKEERGVKGEYYNNEDLSGDPILTRTDSEIDFQFGPESPAGIIDDQTYSARWTGTLNPPEAGTYTLSLASDDGSRLYLNDELIIDNWGPHDEQQKTTTKDLDSESSYSLRVEYYERQGDASITLGWDAPHLESQLQQAIKLAEDSDAAIVFASGSSTEGRDRDDLVLDRNQNQLISGVLNANERSTVVLRTGGPVVMPWIENASSVLEMWYPGQEDGNATAAVLFGDTDPAGRLPITFGKHFDDYPIATQGQYPGIDEPGDGDYPVAEYSEGVFVGYRYFDEHDIDPLFPFGHGLSYSSFKYEDLQISDVESTQTSVKVQVTVKNTGDRNAQETLQLYIEDEQASVDRPPKELKGFRSINLCEGESKRLSFTLEKSAFSFWDSDCDSWIVEEGKFNVLIGRSSRDIRLSGSVQMGE